MSTAHAMIRHAHNKGRAARRRKAGHGNRWCWRRSYTCSLLSSMQRRRPVGRDSGSHHSVSPPAAVGVGHIAAECVRSKTVVDRKMRDVFVHCIGQFPNHELSASCCRLENELDVADAEHHPCMLTVDIRLVDAQDAPDEELSVRVQLGQLATGQTRKIPETAAPR